MTIECPKCQHENPDETAFCGKCGTKFDADVGLTKTLETPTEELRRGGVFAGRYEIIEELGKGGMGKVYRVEDKKAKEEIALKLIKPEIAADKKTIERFRNELTTARKISHRNVCRMYDLGEEKGAHFITMEYVPGEDLKSLIRRVKVDIGTTIKIAKQVCEGLSEAHRLGVVHRDLKPSNIMIDKEGEAKIMDFGIARTIKEKRITGSGVMIGTPEYMSPEQVEAKDIDQRTDIYALGIILYEMVTGQLPFEGETPLAVAMMHKGETAKNPKELNAQITDELSSLILKCLLKNKNERYQTAVELFTALDRLEQNLPSAEREIRKKKTLTSKEITVSINPKRLILPVATVIILALAAFLILKLIKTAQRETSLQPTFKRITYLGLASSPAISPDGNSFAFIESDSEGEGKLLIQSIEGGQSLEIYRGKFLQNLQWLPDGNKLMFKILPNDRRSPNTYMISRFGGNVEPLGFYSDLSWSPDGIQFGWIMQNSTAITITNHETGAVIPLPLNIKYKWLLDLEWSPSGNYFLLLTREGNTNSLSVISIDGRIQNLIYSDEAQLVSPRWSPDGKNIYFVRKPSGTTELWKLSVTKNTGKVEKPATLLLSGYDFSYYSISDDGKRLLFQQMMNYSNLYSLALNEPGNPEEATLIQLTDETSVYGTPRISPNNEKIAFSKSDTEGTNIYSMPLAGGTVKQLTFWNARTSCPAWSPDGDMIAFGSSYGDSLTVWIMDSEGGIPTRISKNILSESLYTIWAPGKSILAQKNGNRNFFIINPETGEEQSLVENEKEGYLFFPQMSPDGKKVAIAWNRGQSTGLYIFSFENKSQTLILKLNPQPIGWSPDSSWIYFREIEIPDEIKKIRAIGGEPEYVVKIPFKNLGTLMDMTSDGKKFIFTVRETKSDIWLLENFDPEKK